MERKLPVEGMSIMAEGPEKVTNPISGESMILPPDAVAVYDSLRGAEYLISTQDFGDVPEDYVFETLQKCRDWLAFHEPRAYQVLVD